MVTATRAQPCVTIKGQTISVGTQGYEVKVGDVHSQLELINWIKHLNRKRWVTPQHIEQFIDVVCEAKGWAVDA